MKIEFREFNFLVFLNKLQTVIKPHIFNANHELLRNEFFNITIIDKFMKVSHVQIDFAIDIFEESSLLVCWEVMSIVENLLYFLFGFLWLGIWWVLGLFGLFWGGL
jgi:hypothetical protein